jgi:hypothetical protein
MVCANRIFVGGRGGGVGGQRRGLDVSVASYKIPGSACVGEGLTDW